ncbi:DUF2000 family protein [SAR116 cluster bacterium]|nr:DUF2000 family protein [SAR116 cluster bacterium]
MFDTKIAIIIREDLATWQKLNVTAFQMSGITGANPGIVGKTHQDRGGKRQLAMSVQPVIVLAGTANVLTNIRNCINDTRVDTVGYIEEMFSTGHDEASRAIFAEHDATEANTVGIALRADKKIVDKITKGARMRG